MIMIMMMRMRMMMMMVVVVMTMMMIDRPMPPSPVLTRQHFNDSILRGAPLVAALKNKLKLVLYTL
jgi:hypothetical protein